ncbi:alpha-2-macroglobulin-like protein 1 isoform X1 [Mya arenaria]|uniref:alpha-2-macroglobulin-like protein 1 isoform X1 n=1 Tax=Mya arenaria TaxID=6604 RepID=UPI0022E1BD7B|nr:alpha-2-macroglobulin-like protein 1 isoform X1 [Mya arenaria]
MFFLLPEPYDTQAPVSNLRRHFPETWLWELYEIPANGNVSFTEKMPDTITEWVGNTVCLHESAGLGISDVASVTGYQPFFVDVKLPYSAVRGELLTVDVSVFNYLPHCVAVQVDIIEGAWFILEPHEDNQFCICSNVAQAYTFKIRPHTLGRNSITVSAFLREHRVSCHSTQSPPGFLNKRATELLVRDILVQAEGFEEEKTLSKFICPQDSTDGVYSEVLQPDVPDTDYIVPGSLRGWVNIVGDILGPVLDGLEDIVQLPTGCGEQNLIRLAPNIAVLRYLTVTGQITNDIELKTISHLEKGYQQQLQFLHTDGSYSAFGPADDKGSTWLTAFVFKTLAHAQEFIYIDRKNIQTKSWEFLLNKQGEDGCFYERGKVLSKYMMGGVGASQEDHKRALTAYVLTAMLESFQMMRERTPPFVALAVRCIQVEDLTDTYTHALVAYAMALYKPTSRFTSIIIDNLREKAIVRGDTMHWRREKHPDILSGQGRAASAEVEITAYALLAILSQDKNAAVGEIIPIVRWLTSQRNSYGGFASTQDTVVALQALALFSRRVYGDGIDVKVSLTDENSASLDFHVLHSNRIILQRRDLPNPGSQLTLNAKGEGCILFQWTSRYNVENKVLPDDVFNVSVTTPVTKSVFQKECKGRTIHICASYHGKDYLSNMVIVEVRIPTGWRCDMETFQQYSNQVKLGLKKYEVNKEFDNVINFYFEEMDKTDRCFDIQVYQEAVTEDNKAAVVRVIDYYESGQQTAMFYKMSECTEENVKDIDVNIDTEKGESDDSDIFFNGDRINAVLDQAANPVDNDGDGAAAPPTSKSTCPSCHVSGIVNILSDICTRQVWLLEPNGGNFMLRIIAGDGVSPPLEILLPNSVQFCTDCQPFVRDQGMKSIMLVNPYDWSDLGANIMQSSTKIIPWSESLEAALLGILKQCVKH